MAQSSGPAFTTHTLFEAAKTALDRFGISSERIAGEKKAGSYITVRISGQRWRVLYTTSLSFPNPGAPGYLRINPSKVPSGDRGVVVIAEVRGETLCYYAFRHHDLNTLLRNQGHAGRRSESREKLLRIPHPPQEDSEFEPFRNCSDAFM